MEKKILSLCGYFFLLSATAGASPELDARYAFRSVVATVVASETKNLHTQTVQSELEKFFQRGARFNLVTVAEQPTMATLARVQAEQISAWEKPVKAVGADFLVLAQVQKNEGVYQVALVAAVMDPPEVFFETQQVVQDPLSLKSFAAATVDALTALQKSLPFDASVVSREGYRLVLDRGAAGFKPGSRLPVFTLEKGASGLALKEVGLIQIKRVEHNLCFATVLVESKPNEIAKGNKVKFGAQVEVSSDKPRDLASVPVSSISESTPRNGSPWVQLEAQLAAMSLNWERVPQLAGDTYSKSALYTGAQVRGVIKLTNNAFAELDGGFGSSGLNASQYTQLRLLSGYRFGLLEERIGPQFFVRGGFSQTRYSATEVATVLGPTSASFSGLLLGLGLSYPLIRDVELGIDLNALVFSSLSESGGKSGARTTGVSGWDFSVRGVYQWSESLAIEGKLVFQTNAAGFTGGGARPIALASLNQTSRTFSTGVRYAF